MRCRLLLHAFLLGLLALLPAAAQQAPAGSFDEAVDVRLVNVEAVVTDRHGARVQGLGADDFRLLVDGREVPIEFFTEVYGGIALAGVAGGSSEVPVVLPGEPLGTSYLVFIDEFFTLNTDRQTVLKALLDDLDFMNPEDRMAIVAWDGSRVDMLSSWSGSNRDLQQALREALERPAYGLHRVAERRQVDRGLRFQSVGFRQGELTIEESVYTRRLTDQLTKAVRAATATLRGFGQPPGRKVMLMISGGWPWMPADFVDGTPLGAFYDRSFYRGGEELYGSLVETANLLGYTLYPLDAPGLELSSGAEASRALPSSVPSLTNLNVYQEQEMHSSLLYLARETGGEALLNGRRTKGLELAQADTRSYYWLGFTPDRRRDDAPRSIEVEVLRDGLKLRSRSGFRDYSKETEVAMAVESALLFGQPPGPNNLLMEFGSPQRAGRGKIDLPLTIHIPIDQIALLPVGEQEYLAQLRLQVAVLDGRGDQAEAPSIPIEVRRSSLPEPGESLTYETTIRMRRSPHDLVVAVYDEGSGALLSASAEIGP